MEALHEDEAWHMATAAAAFLEDRVWLVEARSGAHANDCGVSMVAQYECVNVQIHDPKSHAFAQLQASRGGASSNIDFAAYAMETRTALHLWTEIAACAGFSAQENPAFWRRVLQEVTPASHGQVSDVPRFFDAPESLFPKFRLTFQPRDCYDEDFHEPSDAFDWVNSFTTAFFDDHVNHPCALQGYFNRLSQFEKKEDIASQCVPIELMFRVPVLRTHGPLGSALEQHRGYLSNAQVLAKKLSGVRSTSSTSSAPDNHWQYEVVNCLAIPRGSIRPSEFSAIAANGQLGSYLRIEEICIELADELSLDAFTAAVDSSAVATLIISVAKATTSSISQLAQLLQHAPHVRVLRLFNAFTGTQSERHEKWRQLCLGLAGSQVQELVLERTHLCAEDAAAFSDLASLQLSSPVVSLTVKPVTNANLSAAAPYLALIKAMGSALMHVDVSALCLQPNEIDELLECCTSVASLRLGNVDDMAQSQLYQMLRQRACRLSSLAVSCTEADAQAIASVLSNQPLNVALSLTHLTQLSLSVDAVHHETSEALLQMLATNQSLQYFHLKSRSLAPDAAALDPRFAAHHNSQLVRKLPIRHKVAFLSVLAHSDDHAAASAVPTAGYRALDRFDAGVASEILSFAGHAVCRRFHSG